MSSISTWSKTASSNNSASPNGFPEGMAPSGVNNSARELMAAIRTQWEDAQWFNYGDTVTYSSGTVFTISGDQTEVYTVNRRIRAVGATTGTIYGTITASAYSSVTTVTVSWDSGSIQNESLAVSLGIVDPSNSAINKISVGLGNVNNTSDADKPISDATQTALDLKAPLASPTFTGNPAAPTQSAGDNSTKIATTAYVENELTSQVFGIGQDYYDKTASRSLGVDYSNLTGKPFWLTVRCSQSAGGVSEIVIGGDVIPQFGSPAANSQCTLYAIVPAGSTYRVNQVTPTVTLVKWWELTTS